MRRLFLPLFLSLFFLGSSIARPVSTSAQASNCCAQSAAVGSGCTTLSGSSGTCQTSGNVEPYLSQCAGANPPVLSCLPQCTGVYCASGAASGSNCTTSNGNNGTCTNPPHTEPYLTQCPNVSGSLACLAMQPPAGCCNISEQGHVCILNSTTQGTCRAPSGGTEITQCPYWDICAPTTGSGSFLCGCTRTSSGYNCQVVSSACQGGLQPNITLCSPQNTTNPCGGNASYTTCNLPCVPGGSMAWGSYGCLPFDPNAIPPIPQSQLCLPGLVCQNGGFCMKPDGSANFSETCIWNSECGTCLNGSGGTVQLACVHNIPNQTIGICDGQCGGNGGSNPFCTPQGGSFYSGINSGIGCIPYEGKPFLTTAISWATGIAGGIAFVVLLYAALLITTAAGDPKKIQSGRELLSSALVGLALIMLAVVLANFLGAHILRLDLFGFRL